MTKLLIVPGLLVILVTLWDAFETMIPPRRVQRTWKLARWYFTDESVKRMRVALGVAWPAGSDGDEAEARLKEIRRGYEPHMQRLSESLLMPLPPWFPENDARDDWESE